MGRCLELAALAAGLVAPNPMVGSVLVHGDRVIGEGYHQLYGQAHAEVNCIRSVKPEDRHLIPESTIYVSLEPCAHHGKTPPCADLIIRERIPRVVVGCRDPFPEVNGKGIEKLLAAGVDVQVGVLEAACRWLNRRFFTFHERHRPYIILKWAQTANGRVSGAPGQRLLISNDYSNRLVHRWRSEEAAILVGTNTAEQDDPSLTVRHWTGPNPVRLVIDRELRLPRGLRLFDGTVPTVVFNQRRDEEAGAVRYYRLADDGGLVDQLNIALRHLKLQSVLIEGGTMLLQSFIDAGYWDEARIITNEDLMAPEGSMAPVVGVVERLASQRLASDRIDIYKNPQTV